MDVTRGQPKSFCEKTTVDLYVLLRNPTWVGDDSSRLGLFKGELVQSQQIRTYYLVTKTYSKDYLVFDFDCEAVLLTAKSRATRA